MIPEKWSSIYLYASVFKENGKDTGEMYFYYYPKGLFKKNPVNVYEIPSKFNIEESSFMRLAEELYKLIVRLKYECLVHDKTDWSNITITIENVDFLVEYNCDDLLNSKYNSEDRRKIWQYKYLEYSIDKFNKQERNMIDSYLEEEMQGKHGVTIYSETFYQEHAHNNIQYDIETEVEDYITDEEIKEREEEKKKKKKSKEKIKEVDFNKIEGKRGKEKAKKKNKDKGKIKDKNKIVPKTKKFDLFQRNKEEKNSKEAYKVEESKEIFYMNPPKEENRNEESYEVKNPLLRSASMVKQEQQNTISKENIKKETKK
jgi:hypothetical protein